MLRDSALISALIVERPMCVPCIARKTRVTEAAAHTCLDVIRRALKIECVDRGTCSTCGQITRVFSAVRPD